MLVVKNALLVGSGQIKRRLTQRRARAIGTEIQALRNEVRRYKERDPRNTTTKRRRPLRITTHDLVVLNHWNSKGPPFTTHHINRENPTKTLRNSVRNIHKIFKAGHIAPDVCDSIDKIHYIFTHPEFKLKRSKIGIDKITLASFIYYSRFDLEQIRKAHPSLAKENIESWFKLGCDTRDYLEHRFFRLQEDLHPQITQQFEDIWRNYKGNGFEFNTTNLNILRRLSGKAMKFADLNPDICPPLEVVERVRYMIENMNYKPPSLHFLLSDYFWNEELPEELIRWGHLDRAEIKLLPEK